MNKDLKFLILVSITLILFSCNETQKGIEGNNNDNNTVVQGDNNVVDKSTNYITRSSIKVQKLYPEILIDYKGVSIKRIIQDFGEASSEIEEAVGFIGPGYESENHKYYGYGFDNGGIAFYVDKENQSATVVEVSLSSNSDVKILIPPIHDRGGSYPKIALGKSTFGDLFSIDPPNDVISNWGSAPGAVYTEAEFYFGRFGNYNTYTFGIHGLEKEEAMKDYKVLSSLKPDYVIIH